LIWSQELSPPSQQVFGSKIADFFRDREYYSRLLKFALPISLQQLIFTSLNLVGSVMVGQLGATTVAAVSLAGQIFFLFNLMVFGIGSGSAMFTAQLWGRRDVTNIRKVLGLALTFSLAGALFFLAISEFIPATVLSIYSNDPEVLYIGSNYLRIFGFSFLFFSITAVFSLILRSTGQVRLPVLISIFALLFNTALSYILIFGKLGFPTLGANGAAIAILISRMLECILLVSFTYYLKLPPAGHLRELFSYDLDFTKKVLSPVLPVAINEILWSTGVTAYQIIYAHIGTNQLAAVNIASTISDLAVVAFIGIGNATAILVGNLIGSDQNQRAQTYAGRSLILGLFGGILIGLLVLLISPAILDLYKVTPVVTAYAYSVLLVNCSFLWLRMMNLIQFIGIFRAGGDTRFALVLDGLIIWIVGVPLTAFGAFVLDLPIYLVYALTLSEELAKGILGLWRYFSKKWIHNLTLSVSEST
jgi:putative MATE family efflux protein